MVIESFTGTLCHDSHEHPAKPRSRTCDLGSLLVANCRLLLQSAVLAGPTTLRPGEHLLRRYRQDEVHLRASWILTRADVIANVGVIAAGVLVIAAGSRWPDLIIGTGIGLYVLKEAAEIVREARSDVPTH
jgi:Co/Zn/Cd efflux system component